MDQGTAHAWAGFVLGVLTGVLIAMAWAEQHGQVRPTMTSQQIRAKLGTLGWTSASQLTTLVLLAAAELDRSKDREILRLDP